MKTYKETLEHIKCNKHRLESTYGYRRVGVDLDKLNLVTDILAFIYEQEPFQVTNDYADIKV